MANDPGFFKRNERVIMVVLLALIAPTFAFTGIIGAVIGGADNTASFYFRGEPITNTDKFRFQSHLALAQASMMASFQGQVRQNPSLPRDVLIDAMITDREADRLGIRVTDAEFNDYMRDTLPRLLAQYRLWRANPDFSPLTEEGRTSLEQKEAEGLGSDWKRDYRDMLTSKFLGRSTDVESFEEAIRAFLRYQKLNQVVRQSVVVSEAEVFEEFRNADERKGIDFVRIPTDRFAEEAKAQVTEEDMKNYFTRNRFDDRFRSKRQIKLEIAKITDPKQFQPTDEEVTARYEENKEDYLLTKGDDPTYRPLAEVRGAIELALLEEKQASFLESALTEAETMRHIMADAAGEGAMVPNDLKTIFPEARRSDIEVFETDWIVEGEETEVAPKILNQPFLASMFTRSRWIKLQKGSFCTVATPMSDGAYIYRVIDRVESAPMEYDEADQELLRGGAAEAKLGQLGREYLEEWKTKIEEDDSVTFESFAETENYTIHSTEPLSREEAGGIRINGTPVAESRQIFSAVSQLEEVGDVTGPILGLGQKATAVYLAKFRERADPDPAKFADRKEQIRSQLLSKKQNEAMERFRNMLREETQSTAVE